MRFFVVALLLLSVNVAEAQVRVRGYYRKNGTYVRPHTRSYPGGRSFSQGIGVPATGAPFFVPTAGMFPIGPQIPYRPPFLDSHGISESDAKDLISSKNLDLSKVQFSRNASGEIIGYRSKSGYHRINSSILNSRRRSDSPKQVASASRKISPPSEWSEERIAESQLHLAMQLLQNKKFIEAATWLQRIIEEYPGTSAAGRAAELLESNPDLQEALRSDQY